MPQELQECGNIDQKGHNREEATLGCIWIGEVHRCITRPIHLRHIAVLLRRAAAVLNRTALLLHVNH